MIGTQIDQDQIEDQVIGHTILGNGSSVAARSNLDFIGSGITVLDSSETDTTQVVISGIAGPAGPAGELTPLEAAVAVNKTADGIKTYMVAGQTMNFGDAGYILSDGKVSIGDASELATSSCAVMCIEDTVLANASGEWLLFGFVRDDLWNWIPGNLVYLTISGLNNATLTQTAPTGANQVIQILGVATDTNKMLFNPQLIQIEHL